MKSSLTPHPEGSLRELWSIALPLMISSLASVAMIFVDRIFLAYYSVEALNASASAGTLAWGLMAGVGMVTAMSEVFVAQYNGAKQHERLGTPAWQMIWVALFSTILFLPVAFWGGDLIFANSRYAALETTYFKWLLFFGPSYALMTALSGFFIGRGKTKLLIWVAILANLLNVIFDRALIFGIEGWVPELGIQGAAIATSLGYLFEAAVLAYFFFKEENRREFGTNRWKIDWQEMKKCCRVGIPQGMFYGLEMVGIALFYWLMEDLGEKHITISSICQSFIILFAFFGDGLSRGATAVAGNFIGAGRHDLVYKSLKSGAKLLLAFSIATGCLFILDPTELVRLLFIHDLDVAFEGSLKTCMAFSFIYLVIEATRWLFAGILAAAGDTFFLLLAGIISVWGFLLAPIYWIVVKNQLGVEYAWGIMAAYAVLFLIIYALRFKQGAWKKIDLVQDEVEEQDAS